MTLWVLLMLSQLAAACGPIIHGLDQTEITTNEILAKVQGDYVGCVPSPIFAGYYQRVVVTLVGRTYQTQVELATNSSCSGKYYRYTRKFDIVSAAYKTDDNNSVIFTLKSQNQYFRFNHNFYISQNYCGYTNWVLDVDKDLNGVYCPDLLASDVYHTSFRAVGEIEFQELRVSSTSVSFAIGEQQSGDTFATRFISPMLTATRQ